MPDTTFTDYDPSQTIHADWLNDVNKATYRPDLKSTIGGLTVGSVTLNHATAAGTVFVADTNPMNWAAGPGRMTVDFELISNSYFAANPNGHFRVVLRQDPAQVGTNVRGQGILCGNGTGFTAPNQVNPTTLAETFMTAAIGAPSDHYVWNMSSVAPKFAFQDGVNYKFSVESTKTVDDNRYIRYRVWSRPSSTHHWTAEVDSGDILDHNIWADLTQSGLMFEHVVESNLVTWSLAFTNCKVTWGPATVAVPDSSVPAQITGKVKVGVIGDSMPATNSLIEPAWPEILAVRLGALNAPIEMHNLSKDGWTYHKANTVATFGTLTMVQQAIYLDLDVVIVSLGANDATLNIEGRSLVQCEADALAAFAALRAGLPNATIIYASELMFDVANFPTPGTTLKNKAVPVYQWQAKTSGILTGMITSEVLDDSVAAGTKTNYSNWVSLDTYIKALGTISGSFTVPYFKALRLGLVGVDNIHLTAMGHVFLAAAAVKTFQTLPALSRLFSTIMDQAYSPWNDPDAVFTTFLTVSGDGYVDAAYDSQVTQFAKHSGLWSRVNPDIWYFPSKAVAKVFPTAYTADSFSVPYWSIMNARPNTLVEVSVNGSAFATSGQSTDAYGCANFPYIAGQLTPATYTTRYRVGNEVYGPYVTVVSAPTEPYLFVRQTGSQATAGANSFNKPTLGTMVEDTSVTWTGSTATIQRAGRYNIQAQVALDAMPDQGAVVALIYKNGTRFIDGNLNYVRAAGAAFVSSTVGVSLRLAAGDTIDLWLFQLGGGVNNISVGAGQATYLTIGWDGF